MAPIVGSAYKRLEGGAKVLGSLRFGADLAIDNLAHGRLVLSNVPHARIRSISKDAAEALPGVLAVITGADLPAMSVPGPDLPLARDRVHYVGQPIAVVVGETESSAADGAALVEVDYEELPAVIDPFEAMLDGAACVLDSTQVALDSASHGMSVGGEPLEHRRPNVSSATSIHRGDALGALREAEVVIRRQYLVAAVHQGFIETHVSIARDEPDGKLTIWTSTQGTFLARTTIAKMLGLSPSVIRVVPMPVGGGFGGKVCLLEPLVALLCRLLHRTVKIALTRSEEFLMGRGGPAAHIDIQVGARRDGTLTAIWGRVTFDHGAGPGGLGGRACSLLGGTYRVPNLDLIGQDVATHKTPTGWYRAPGGPQVLFALESTMDELAAEIGMDPIDLRLKNAVREGDVKPDGNLWPRIGLIECLERAKQHPLYTTARSEGEGLGVAVVLWGGGVEPAVAVCNVEPDGSLTLHLSSVDISGTNTTLAMIAAEAFGTRVENILIETGDTASAPFAGMSGGSKITYTVGLAVQRAAEDAKRQILEIAAEELEADTHDLEIEDGEVRVVGVGNRSISVGTLARLATQFGSRYPPVHGTGRTAISEYSPMAAVHLASVRVDRITGAYRITGYAAIQDVGHALNPPEIEGQIHGGTVQGLGRALGEELIYDSTGQLNTVTFLDYMLPTIDQVPPIDVQLVEIPSPQGPMGARGVGEPPAVPGAAAVANAIFRATGYRATHLPISEAELAEMGTRQ